MGDPANITYRYVPENWDEERFQSLGGMTAVFLNYNKRRTVPEAVESVLAQDYPLVECFFMDDASSDGSGDVMEGICRGYQGRFKVTVVRNETNKGICGQWNTVSRLATGQWLGMFCGDDVSYPDRVTTAVRFLTEHPSLRGFSMNGVKRLMDGSRGDLILSDGEEISDGQSPDFYVRALSPGLSIGATAFYHRSLFDRPLPNVPLDDILLWWIVQLKYFGSSPNPIYLFDRTQKTIHYGVGEGITSSFRVEKGGLSPCAKWIIQRRELSQFARLMVRTFHGIERYMEDNGPFPIEMVRGFRARLLREQIAYGTTFSRISLIPRLMAVHDRDLFVLFFRRFFFEFLGLHVAAFLSCRFIHRNKAVS